MNNRIVQGANGKYIPWKGIANDGITAIGWLGNRYSQFYDKLIIS